MAPTKSKSRRDNPNASKPPEVALSHWMWPAFAAAVLVLVAAYSNSLHNSFHFDDSHVIVDNLYIRSLANIPHFFTDGRTFSSLPSNAIYRPVVSTTLAVDYSLASGLDPLWFHITQLTLLV